MTTKKKSTSKKKKPVASKIAQKRIEFMVYIFTGLALVFVAFAFVKNY